MLISRNIHKTLMTVGLSLLLPLGVTGCGGGNGDQAKTVSVTGIVLYNGKPVPMGTVMFTPVAGGPPATGEIQPDGSFVMMTYVDGDGAVIGEHTVIVTAIQPASGLPEDPDSGPKVLVPEKFSNSKTSGLTATIEDKDENVVSLMLSDKG